MITQNLPDQPASRGMHLLRTKLNIPHPHADRVELPWLVQRLESGLKARLIVISVPAGSSKTTLVSVWASQCKQPG
jgi:LuxR family maltose regulon positive regulatory protein